MDKTEKIDFFRLWLRDLFDRKIVKQVQLANSLDIDPHQISDYINGRRNFSEKRKHQIADYFTTTYTDALIKGRQIAEGQPPAEINKNEKDDDPILGDDACCFNAALRYALDQNGVGADYALSNDTGLSQTYIGRLKESSSAGTFETREKIADALGMSQKEMIALGRRLLRKAHYEPININRKVELIFPEIRTYVEMLNLAAENDDLALMGRIVESGLKKFLEKNRIAPTERADVVFPEESGEKAK